MDIWGGCELPEDWPDSIAVIGGKYGQPNLDEGVSVASQKSAPDYNTTMIMTSDYLFTTLTLVAGRRGTIRIMTILASPALQRCSVVQ